MILLACIVVVVDEVVVWVCAFEGAMAKPRKANVAPNSIDVFIIVF
jgi:hypothetical protein